MQTALRCHRHRRAHELHKAKEECHRDLYIGFQDGLCTYFDAVCPTMHPRSVYKCHRRSALSNYYRICTFELVMKYRLNGYLFTRIRRNNVGTLSIATYVKLMLSWWIKLHHLLTAQWNIG